MRATALLVLVGLSLVALGFWLMGKLDLPTTLGYIGAQLVGMFLAILVFSFLAERIEVAKLYHFESDRRRFFRQSNTQ